MKKLSLIILGSFLFIAGCGSGIKSGEGKKIGQIVKIGEHGMFCRTYEAEIIRGGFNGGTGINGAALDFTIKDKKLYSKLVETMEKQQEIELEYVKRGFTGSSYSETQTIAVDFKILENSKNRSKPEKEEKIVQEIFFKTEETGFINP